MSEFLDLAPFRFFRRAVVSTHYALLFWYEYDVY